MSFFSKMKAGIDQWFEKQQAELDRKKALEASRQRLLAGIVEEERLGAAGRLQRHFDRLQEGSITIDDYLDEIVFEQDQNKIDLADLRSDRRSMSAGDFEDAKDRLEEDRDDIAWRLDWAKKRSADRSLQATQPEISGNGKWARFEYVDNEGAVTKREVVNWEVSGRYVRGFCKMRKEERSFRIDRISEWIGNQR